MARATIDFETRSKVNLKIAGAYRYAIDPSTLILCMAYRLPGEGIAIWKPNLEPFPGPLALHIENGGIIEAHNAGFEYAIWKYCLRRLYKNAPDLPLAQLECSAAKAAAVSMPRALEKLAQALRLPVQKDMTGNRVMQKLSKPRKPTAKNPAIWHDVASEYETLYEYCKNDVLVEEAASRALPELPDNQKHMWRFTEAINERGIFCDLPLVKNAIGFLEEFQAEKLIEFKNLTKGKVETVKQLDKLKDHLFIYYGVDLPNLSADTVVEYLARQDVPDEAKKILKLRQLLAKSSVTKYVSMFNVAGPDERIRGTLVYHGASTGRYTGRLIQPQNYAKTKIKDVENVFELLKMGDYEFFKTVFPDVFTALASGLRGMLRAAPGNKLYAGDFSAIEARILLWLARDEKNLKLWREGKDPYVYMAKDIYGVEVDAVTPTMRDMGKRAILGSGYGMGADKFKKTCLAQGGVIISEDFSKKVIGAYRDKHPLVVKFWREVEDAAKNAIRNRGEVVTAGLLKFKVEKDFLWVKLPSGRKIAYREPCLRNSMTKWGPREEIRFMAEHPITRKWLSEATYGGRLVENCTQAVAYDVMADAMTRLEAQGYPPTMTIHDEIVCETPEGYGGRKIFELLMSKVPKWADGLPLAVSAWEGQRYKK